MKKKLFARMVLLSLLTIGAVFFAGAFAVRRNSAVTMQDRMEAEVDLLDCLLRSETELALLQAYCPENGLQIAVYTDSGACLYASLPDLEQEYGWDSEELAAACDGTPRLCERYSNVLQCRMSFYAARVRLESGAELLLRLAMPNREILSFFQAAVPCLLVAVLVSWLLSAIVSARISKTMSGRIGEVAESLRSMSSDTYKPVLSNPDEPEYDALVLEINELNRKTQTVMRGQIHEREKLTAVLDIVAQGILAVDPAFRIVLANRSALQLFGGAERNIGKSLLLLISDEALCGQIHAHEAGGYFEYRYGDRRLVVNVKAITDSALSQEISQLVIVTDVTELRNIAEEKSDFFANASHELKTPITVTQGLSELILAKDGLEDGIRTQVERIHKETLRMSGLITDMLRLSKLEQQHGEVKQEPVALRGIVDEVLAELRTRIAEKALTVCVQGEGTVQALPERMYDLVTNLCSNAVNYNVDGGRLEVHITEADGRTVLIVSDTGIGIPKEHLPRICERFYRVDKSRSKKTGGTGLGLAIVKHICALYGAELKIDSAVGRGTTVSVRFEEQKQTD